MALIGVYADWEGLDGPERIGYSAQSPHSDA